MISRLRLNTLHLLGLKVSLAKVAQDRVNMILSYEALLVCLVLLVNNGAGKKMSFTFKKTDGTDTLQIVDFHVMQGKVIKETGEIMM